MLGGDECAADLPGDFTFADDGGIQPGADGKKVLADFGAGPGAEGAGDELFAQAAGR